MRELYVWYRMHDRHAHAARAAVLAMQRSLVERFPGLQARLLIRRDDVAQTWMETYARAAHDAADGEGIDRVVEAAIAAAALPWSGFVDGERHVEAFEAASATPGTR